MSEPNRDYVDDAMGMMEDDFRVSKHKLLESQSAHAELLDKMRALVSKWEECDFVMAEGWERGFRAASDDCARELSALIGGAK